MSPPDGQSLTMRRGIRVLRVLANHPDGLTVSELADELVTHRASIYRLLGPLTEERLVVRGSGGRHLISLGLLELASAVRPRLQDVAAPITVPGHPSEACISAVWVDDRDPVPYGEAVVRAARAIAAGL